MFADGGELGKPVVEQLEASGRPFRLPHLVWRLPVLHPRYRILPFLHLPDLPSLRLPQYFLQYFRFIIPAGQVEKVPSLLPTLYLSKQETTGFVA